MRTKPTKNPTCLCAQRKLTKPKREPTIRTIINAGPLRRDAGRHEIRLGGKSPPQRRGPREVGLGRGERVGPAAPERGDEAVVQRGADDGALGDLVEVVALVDALVAHEARDEVRRLAQQAERGAEAARRAEVVRDGDGEGVLVDDAVPPAPRHEDDVAGPAVRLDEVRMRLRLGVERARPPVQESTGDVGSHILYVSQPKKREHFGYSPDEGMNPGRRLTAKKLEAKQ